MEALRLGHRVVVLGGAPARVVECVEPGGPVPREAGNPELTARYAALMARLMNGEAA
jgi:putative hydroxymethylpyrimidine transport system ATP-binding protein